MERPDFSQVKAIIVERPDGKGGRRMCRGLTDAQLDWLAEQPGADRAELDSYRALPLAD